MLIRCVKEFRDFASKGEPLRKVGEEWEATPERLAEINRAGYGKMAEAVETPAEQPETAPAARKAATPKKGAATRRTTRKSAQEG